MDNNIESMDKDSYVYQNLHIRTFQLSQRCSSTKTK